MTARRITTHIVGLFLILFSLAAQAETRRAVVIGINKYAVDLRTDRARDLDGAVNDAQAMVETLRTYHGFAPSEIQLLLDQQATREHILKALQDHLIDAAQPGDLSLFYFAGHGSYRANAASKEVDHRDETIVPVDSNRGAADIPDKELARLLNRALDRKASVVAIFDSCHSGSIARGLEGEEKSRFVPPQAGQPETRGMDTAEAENAPEERGALILSAAQDQQPAQEKRIRGQARGRFTSALQQVLNSAGPADPVEELFMQVRALMQAGGSIQEPVLAGTPARRKQGLWGGSAKSSGNKMPRVAVTRVAGTTIYLQSGHAIGLGRQAVLRSLKSTTDIRLQVTEVLGPANSTAVVMSGDKDGVASGDLFEVVQFGEPHWEALRLFLPGSPPQRTVLDRLLRELAPLRAASRLTWVRDPTEQTPTHVLFFREGRWVLRRPQQADIELGQHPTVNKLRSLLKQGTQPAQFFISLPLPKELYQTVLAGIEHGSKSVELTADPSTADYWLIGRAMEHGPEFAWVLPNSDKNSRTALPVRSDWSRLEDVGFRENMMDYAQRLARLKAWQSLASPAGSNPFPYHLRLQNMQTQAFHPDGVPVRAGESYRPVLVASGPLGSVKPRYVYLFALNGHGRSSLLVPRSGIFAGENLLPDRRLGTTAPSIIPLGDGMKVTPPFGTDSLVLLISATALPDPMVLEIEPVQRGLSPTRRCSHPLECMICGINESEERASTAPPVDWSVERLVVQSVEK